MYQDEIVARQRVLYRDVQALAEMLETMARQLRQLAGQSDERDFEHDLTNLEELLDTLQDSSADITGIQDNVSDFLVAAHFLISGRQQTPLTCQLPKHQNPPHVFYRGYTCQSDAAHVFCRTHRLNRCVICGGNLT